MPNPDSIQNGQTDKIDTLADADLDGGLKRGYTLGSEDATSVGSTDALQHHGVVVAPAAVGDVVQVANGAAVATMAAVATKKNYLAGFSIGGLGATSAATVRVTIAGLAIGTMAFDLAVPAGVTVAIEPIMRTFPNPLEGGVNTDIVLTVPDFGAGNTNVDAALWGFVSA